MANKKRQGRSFSVFRSAGEEAEMQRNAGKANDEGGHMSCTSGRIVSCAGAEMPFKAVMTRADGTTFEVVFGSMRDAEAFVQRNTPRPTDRSKTYDRGSD